MMKTNETKERIIELRPIDNRKSFYGKAVAIETNDKDRTILLKSYDTIVAKIENGVFYRLWDGYSATTMRHVNSFIDYYGINGGGKKWWNSLEITN